jgi:hypothetical protein
MNPSKTEYLKQLRIELHKPVKKKFPKLRVRSDGKDDVWSMDLVDMRSWSDYNEGYKWMLNVIDVWTRYAWSVPMKKKNATTVLNAFKQIIKESDRMPRRMWVDEGTEFYNHQMTRYINAHGILRYSTFGDSKSVMVERLNRTLKTEMWKQFTELQTNNWTSRHEQLLEWYNHKPHSGINKRTPYSVSRWPDSDVRLDLCVDPKPEAFLQPKYKLGDVVRISRAKGTFPKGYTANWSEEQFVIRGRRISTCNEPPVYYLQDHQRQHIKGAFYEPEVQLVKYPMVYLVESVLEHDKKNKRMLIKWLGFNDKHNSWIPEDNIIKSQLD